MEWSVNGVKTAQYSDCEEGNSTTYHLNGHPSLKKKLNSLSPIALICCPSHSCSGALSSRTSSLILVRVDMNRTPEKHI